MNSETAFVYFLSNPIHREVYRLALIDPYGRSVKHTAGDETSTPYHEVYYTNLSSATASKHHPESQLKKTVSTIVTKWKISVVDKRLAIGLSSRVSSYESVACCFETRRLVRLAYLIESSTSRLTMEASREIST